MPPEGRLRRLGAAVAMMSAEVPPVKCRDDRGLDCQETTTGYSVSREVWGFEEEKKGKMGGKSYSKTRQWTPTTIETAQLEPTHMAAPVLNVRPIAAAQKGISIMLSIMFALRLAHLRKRSLYSVRSW